ncbi:hypothetical protein [Pseudobutyrivibrio sp.]
MEKHGKITYTLTEEEYLKIKGIVDDIYRFMVNGSEYCEEDAHTGLRYLDKIFEARNYYHGD